MTAAYRPPRPLDPSDDLRAFTCRSGEQTSWLRRHARQANATGTTRVFVVTTASRRDPAVAASYAWCMAQVAIDGAPARVRRGAGRHPQPVALLARLGVDVEHEGRGLGAALLVDVVTRLVGIEEEIGCRGLLIHAESAEARAFHLHLIPELEPSPTDDLHLVLLMKDARRSLL